MVWMTETTDHRFWWYTKRATDFYRQRIIGGLVLCKARLWMSDGLHKLLSLNLYEVWCGKDTFGD